MKALIIDGRVVETYAATLKGVPLAERYHPSLIDQMVDAPDEVQPGWVHADGQFSPPPGPPLAGLKSELISQLRANINTFIERLPNGEARYDRAKKDNIINASLKALAAGNPLPAKGLQVGQWIEAVQAEYYRLKGLIQAAPDAEALDAIDVTINTLEGCFGVAGATVRDPGVSTADLLGE